MIKVHQCHSQDKIQSGYYGQVQVYGWAAKWFASYARLLLGL